MKLLSLTEFIGHFHPLLVHLPIGILLIALLLMWLSHKHKYQSLKPAVPVVLLGGTVTAAASCLTGYALSISDDYDKTTVSWHLWMALAVLFVSFLLYLKERNAQFAVNKNLLAVALLILIGITGHLGGSLTHGSGYITQPLIDIFATDSAAVTIIKPVTNVQEAIAYNDVVRPILQTKCFGCHNAAKQKGGLRMDDITALMKGGKNGSILEPGNAAASEIIKRLLLPVDNDKHMPPKEKPQPTESQIALLHWWINTGADFNKKVKALDQPAKLKPMLAALQQAEVPVKKERDDLPLTPVDKADEKAMAQLRADGIVVLPVAQNSNYLQANFVTDSVVNESDLKLLEKLKQQLVWLRLDNTTLNNNAAIYIGKLNNLTRLNVANTLISDLGVQQFASLKNLRYLNLSGTKVTAAGLMQLKSLAKLKSIYIFETEIKSGDFTTLKKAFTSAVIDSGGYQVNLLVTDTTVVKPVEKK